MCVRKALLALAFVAALAGVSRSAAAQDEPQPRKNFSSLINIEALIDNYARLLARKYDLNEEQDRFTQQFLHEKARHFLDRHEDDLRVLIDRLIEVRTGGEIDPAELIEWGKHVLPIYEEAKLIIVDGNQEWRELLTPEQRKVHDEDLKLMHESFQTTEDQLQRIATGQMTVEEFRKPQRRGRSTRRDDTRVVTGEPTTSDRTGEPRTTPVGPDRQRTAEEPPPTVEQGGTELQPPTAKGRPSTPPRPGTTSTGRTATPRTPMEVGRPATPAGRSGRATEGFESTWETYTRNFIEKYKLNEEQTQKALAILKDCQDQGRRYMTARKATLEQLDKKMEELRKATDKEKAKERATELANLQKQRDKLSEPLNRIFENQLKPRLEKIPTRAQRKEAETAPKRPATPPQKTPGRETGGVRPPGKPPPPPPGEPAEPPPPPPEPEPEQPEPEPSQE